MIQHIARGMFGAIIVDPKDPKVWPKADREFLLVQSELWNNPDDVEAMFGRKFDNVIFNGGIWKYHPFFIGAEALEAKPNERVRIYFVNAGPNEFSSLHRSARFGTTSTRAGTLPTNSQGCKPMLWDPEAPPHSTWSPNHQGSIRL